MGGCGADDDDDDDGHCGIQMNDGHTHSIVPSTFVPMIYSGHHQT